MYFSLAYTLHTVFTHRLTFYPAIRSIGRDIKFTVAFSLFYYVRLQISQQFIHISDMFSLILGIAPGMAEPWA